MKSSMAKLRFALVAVAGLLSSAAHAFGTPQEWDDAYEYVSRTPGGTTNAVKATAVTEFLELLGDNTLEGLQTLAAAGENIKFVNGFGTGLAAHLTTFVNSLTLTPIKKTALIQTLHTELHFTFKIGSPTQNAGGEVSISTSVCQEARNAVKFALYHELGHGIWYAIKGTHAADLPAIDHDVATAVMPNENQKMEIFADAVATKMMKADGVLKAAVGAAAGTLFAEEGADKDHPEADVRLARVDSNY